ENIIPWTLIKERQIPTEYRIPTLGDHLYLVVDGRKLSRLAAAGETPAGHVPVKDFRLEKIGDRITGNIVFAVPAGEEALPKSLELRFYDFAHGHLSVPLLGEAADPQAAKPLKPATKNE